MTVSRAPLALAAKVLLPFGFAYLLSYVYRTVNAVIGPELVDAIGMDPAALGLLTSAYFIGFAAFQLPLGILLDRYGPRRVEAALLLVAAAGALLFSRGQSTLALAMGRGLIGLGVSSCLMAAIKANVLWWPASRLPLANGFIMACGGLGAVLATAPVQMALAYTDWRGLFVVLTLATLLMAAAIVAIVPDARAETKTERWGTALAEAGRVFAQPAFRHVAPLGALLQSSFLAYHGLWAGVWLRDVAGLDRTQVGATLALATTAMILGTFGLGAIATWVSRRGIPVLNVLVAGAVAYMLVQLGLIFRLTVPDALAWGGFVLFGSSGSLCYSVLSQVFPGRLAGRANAAYRAAVAHRRAARAVARRERRRAGRRPCRHHGRTGEPRGRGAALAAVRPARGPDSGAAAEQFAVMLSGVHQAGEAWIFFSRGDFCHGFGARQGSRADARARLRRLRP